MNWYRNLQISLFFAFTVFLGGCTTQVEGDSPIVREVAKQTVWRTRSSGSGHTAAEPPQNLRIKDPYLWVYNAKFAQDFGMPERWIDDRLNGVDALAFRTTTSFPLCGWGGNPDACQMSSKCLLEMYFHHDRNPLPWNEALRWTDFWLKNTSVDTLYTLRPLNRAESNGLMKSPFRDPETKKDLQWWYVHGPRGGWGGGPRIASYDRSIFGSYALVVLNYGCLHPDLAGLSFASQPTSPHFSQPYRSITFPMQWRSRIKSVIQKVREEDSRFFHHQLKQLGLR